MKSRLNWAVNSQLVELNTKIHENDLSLMVEIFLSGGAIPWRQLTGD